MTPRKLKIVFLGLSITSSWGNGHATTYRGLIKELAHIGHEITFLEKDVPWYAGNRDLPSPPYCKTVLYSDSAELMEVCAEEVRTADVVIIGSYVPDGISVCKWVFSLGRDEGITAFYDIDTPVTVAGLSNGNRKYLDPELVPHFDLYLSFTGGPILEHIGNHYGARMARPLYCSADPRQGHMACGATSGAASGEKEWDLGYMGTFSQDRQPGLESLMLGPARDWPEGRFFVAGPQYPEDIRWPANVSRTSHIPPDRHPAFYNNQRFTLNITRADMIKAGYSPSVRLFEAAACQTPVISDYWEGLETFFTPGKEILISRSGKETLELLKKMPDEERAAIGERARQKMLAMHTPAHRANALEGYIGEAMEAKARASNKNISSYSIPPSAYSRKNLA